MCVVVHLHVTLETKRSGNNLARLEESMSVGVTEEFCLAKKVGKDGGTHPASTSGLDTQTCTPTQTYSHTYMM